MDGPQETGVKRRGSDATLLLIYNTHFDVVNFVLPSVPDGTRWLGLLDTHQPEAQLLYFSFGETFAMTGWSMLVLGLAAGDTMTRRLRHSMGSILDATVIPLLNDR